MIMYWCTLLDRSHFGLELFNRQPLYRCFVSTVDTSCPDWTSGITLPEGQLTEIHSATIVRPNWLPAQTTRVTLLSLSIPSTLKFETNELDAGSGRIRRASAGGTKSLLINHRIVG